LAESNPITLAWCPGHSGIMGNEKADELAKTGRHNSSVDIKIAVGEQNIDNTIRDWGNKTALHAWNNSKGELKHSKICITPFDEKKAKDMLNNTRSSIRTLTGLLTRHVCTKNI
jgi:RNase H